MTNEPKNRTVLSQSEDGKVVYDPKTMWVTFQDEDGRVWDGFDCLDFADWSEVIAELKDGYGIMC